MAAITRLGGAAPPVAIPTQFWKPRPSASGADARGFDAADALRVVARLLAG
jgi:hypothetical protein